MTDIPDRYDAVTRLDDGGVLKSVNVWKYEDLCAYADAKVAAERALWADKCRKFAKARLEQYQSTGQDEFLHEATALVMVADAMEGRELRVT